jgi:hypothetical protein
MLKKQGDDDDALHPVDWMNDRGDGGILTACFPMSLGVVLLVPFGPAWFYEGNKAPQILTVGFSDRSPCGRSGLVWTGRLWGCG